MKFICAFQIKITECLLMQRSPLIMKLPYLSDTFEKKNTLNA